MKKNKNTRKKSYRYLRKPVIAFICSFIIPLLFFTGYLGTVPVPKEECKSFEKVYDYCEYVRGLRSPYAGMHLYFADGSSYYVEEYCLGDGFMEALEAIEKGTETIFSVHEEYGNIVELSADGRNVFSYEQYTKITEDARESALWCFYFSFVVPLFALLNLIKEKNKYNHR